MNRRKFIYNLAGATVAANLPLTAFAEVSETTLDSGDRKTFIDALCYAPSLDSEMIGRAIDGGLTAAVFDINLSSREYLPAVKELSRWNSRFRETDSRLVSILKAADFNRARNEKKLGIVLACQDASVLGSSLADWQTNLYLFYALGLRVLQLTHNARTHWADSFMEKRDGGVSLAGEQLIAQMNRLGMIVDLSHCSRQTLLDAVQLSKLPCVVTHAGCRSLAATARNKTDDEIRALGKSDCFFGVYNMTNWLTAEPTANLNTVIDHIEHVVQLIGTEKVGFGSDGDLDQLDARTEVARMAKVQKNNAGNPSFEWEVRQVRVPELNAPNRLSALAEGLSKRGFSDEQIDGITGRNFVRLFRQVCG